MKVLVVSQYFLPEGFRINDLVQSLVDKHITVDVLTGKPNYPEGLIYPGYRAWGWQVESLLGATVHRLPLFPRGQRSAWRLAMNYLSFVLSGVLLAPWMLRKRSYDVIFVYGVSPILQAIPALLLGWLRGIKVVLWVQDLWPASLEATGYVRNPRLLRCVEWVVRFIYRRTDLILVQSQGFIPHVAKLVPEQSIVYYPNSVNPIFSRPPAVSSPDIAALEEGFCVVFAGNVGVGQAVEVIADAATLLKHHPAIRFVVIGQGSRWEWLQAQIHERDLTNLYLPGRYPVDAMPKFLQQASALLVTLSDEPIFAATVPNKIQAYMAVGRPIVACLNGEGARLVSEANAGLAVPAQDAKGLAGAVLKLYEMPPEDRAALGANARRYFKIHFDHMQLTDQLIKHLDAQSLTKKGSP